MAMKFLKQLLGKTPDSSGPSIFTAPIRPNRPLYVVGDVHGRADLLDRMLDVLAERRESESDLVFVGDLVDRGEETASVLARVKTLIDDPQQSAYCLMGNHEKMLLEFLDSPARKGKRWLQYGGLQTLMSFGLRQVTERASEEVLVAARDVFAETLPQETQNWLRDLPLRFDSGNVHVVHAAADPDLPMDAQTERMLLWGHEKFDKKFRNDEQWVVHGHTITEEPYALSGRINIDTGAFATGRLTCVKITNDDVEFLTASL
jgi:serine/threonine protein phosphatase 1